MEGLFGCFGGAPFPIGDAAPDRRVLEEAGRTLAILGPDGDAAADGALWAAVIGQPSWDDGGIAAVAARRGAAAAVLAAYRRWGEELFARMRGAYALVVSDCESGVTLAGIDRFGIATLCYAQPAGGLVLGSTTDIVRAHPAVDDALSPQALYGYLFSYAIRAPTTIYAAQRKLQPAEYLVHRDGRLRTGFHWQAPWRNGAEEAAGAIPAVVERAVARAAGTAPAVRVGAFLSGGLDSSTVVGMLRRVKGADAPAFTIGFEDPRYDERPYARLTAAHFGVEHHEFVLTAAEAERLVPVVATAFDEPFGNSSALPVYCCARLARETGVGLLLAGDGGDEIFAGNTRYRDQMRLQAYGRLPVPLRRLAIEPLLAAAPGIARLPMVGKLARYVERARVPLPDRLEIGNPFMNLAVAAVLDPDFAAGVSADEPLRHARTIYERTGSAEPVHRMLNLDLAVTLADNDLRKVSRMCALAGVPVAYPLLDQELVDLAAALPARVQADALRLRHAFRREMAPFLPSAVITKRKHGFGMPFGPWTLQPGRLRDLAADTLRALKARGVFNREFLDGLIAAQERGDESHPFSGSVWDLMMLELWLDSRASARTLPRAAVVAG